LLQRFQRADERYNSGLFHFGREKGRSEPDRLTPNLTVPDDVLEAFLRRMYWPEGPYDFSVFSPDVLGQVYEQFLGKVIRLKTPRTAVVEQKPEVRKAPCGSGSFLIDVYQYLLDWYRDYYVNSDMQKWMRSRPPRIQKNVSGNWRLTTAERKRILLAHVFGVDIDALAVEVTKLALLLKVLEASLNQRCMNSSNSSTSGSCPTSIRTSSAGTVSSGMPFTSLAREPSTPKSRDASTPSTGLTSSRTFVRDVALTSS